MVGVGSDSDSVWWLVVVFLGGGCLFVYGGQFGVVGQFL